MSRVLLRAIPVRQHNRWNGIADLNRAIVAEIDCEDPPSFKRYLRGWITPLADGSYCVRVVPTNETRQLFLIERTTDPEYDTATALLDRGITGKCFLLDSDTGWPIAHFDIEDRARLASRSAAPPPPSEPEHRGATPGALHGDDCQLEYYEDGHPKFSTSDTQAFKRAIDMTDDELAAIASRALTVVK